MISDYPREDNGYAKFWGANKVHYGCEYTKTGIVAAFTR